MAYPAMLTVCKNSQGSGGNIILTTISRKDGSDRRGGGE